MTNNKKYMNTLVEQIQSLRKEGYTEDFKIDGNRILDSKNNDYAPEEVIIKEVYRFEGESNPADSVDLYAVVTDSGSKGCLITAHGPSYIGNDEVIKKIKTDRRHFK